MERKWWTLVAVCVATFMLLLDITIVNVALPDIQKQTGAGFDELCSHRIAMTATPGLQLLALVGNRQVVFGLPAG